MIRFLPVGETPVGVSGPAEDAWVLRAAVGLQEARAERSAARDVLARTAPPWYHLRSARAHRRAETAAARSFIRANAEIQQHERSLEYHGAGADPDEWGVFSLAPGISLEHTLRRLSTGGPEQPPLAAAGALLVKAPPARAAAVLGDVLARIEVERAVSALVAQAPAKTVRDLVDHLPARATRNYPDTSSTSRPSDGTKEPPSRSQCNGAARSSSSLRTAGADDLGSSISSRSAQHDSKR